MQRWPRTAVLALALTGLGFSPSAAGTLCGTVRDAQTSDPVAHAGIFLRTPADAYTGISGASDANGAFCIENIPAGTYDVEVRVDDYQVAYVRGVVIVNTTDVNIEAGSRELQLLRPSPNPTRDVARVAWTLPVAARVKLAIYDVHGRLIRGWHAERLGPGTRSIVWNLRDAEHRRVAAGTYFVHLEADGARRVRSITCLQ